MNCDDFLNCFEVHYLDPVGIQLDPAIDPSPENGLRCRPAPQPGMWDPDERVAVFSRIIHGTITSGALSSATNITLPIFTTLTATNPSLEHPAVVYWGWDSAFISIDADPGVQGAIATLSAVSPNPLIDVGYAVWQHAYPQRSKLSVPGCSAGYAQCPTTIPPGGSATMGWAYRFEGGGGLGTWFAQIGRLYASAMVVVRP